jgi:putative membrane protein
MRNDLTLMTAVAALLTVYSLGAVAKDGPGQQFITRAVQGNLAEVAMGQLAQQKASSAGVRSFGQMLEQDHSKANQEATAAASSLNVTIPTEPNKQQEAAHDQMSKLSGNAFDRAFARHMVDDHKKDISAYEKEAKRSDGSVSEYAKATLPTLEKHLQTARSLAQVGTRPSNVP